MKRWVVSPCLDFTLESVTRNVVLKEIDCLRERGRQGRECVCGEALAQCEAHDAAF